jgi:hypothetical protein
MHDHRPGDSDRNPEVRRERTDANLSWILLVIAAMVFVGVIVHSFVWQWFVGYEQRLDIERQSASPLAAGPKAPTPPEPRLEQIDRLGGQAQDAAASLGVSEAELRRYGHSDESGFVHIPIDRAMDRLAGKLPTKQATAEQDRRSNGLIDDGASNSGRLFQKGGR